MYVPNIGVKIHHLWRRGKSRSASHSSTHGKADHNSEGATIATAPLSVTIQDFSESFLEQQKDGQTSTTHPKQISK